jgi:hypothetical protein
MISAHKQHHIAPRILQDAASTITKTITAESQLAIESWVCDQCAICAFHGQASGQYEQLPGAICVQEMGAKDLQEEM